MSEWEPATDAEVAMRDALRTDDQESYFRILAGVDLLLPVSADVLAGLAPMGWGTWSTGGRTHVLAFTSNAALRSCLADYTGSARQVPYAELANTWPNLEWWLAVNPGLPIEGYLPAWFVAQLARGDLRLPTRGPGREPNGASKIQELGAAALAASRAGGESAAGGPTYDTDPALTGAARSAADGQPPAQATPVSVPPASAPPASAPPSSALPASALPASAQPPSPQPASGSPGFAPPSSAPPVAPSVAPIPPVGTPAPPMGGGAGGFTPPQPAPQPQIGPGGLPMRTPSGTSASGLPTRNPAAPATPAAYQPPGVPGAPQSPAGPGAPGFPPGAPATSGAPAPGSTTGAPASGFPGSGPAPVSGFPGSGPAPASHFPGSGTVPVSGFPGSGAASGSGFPTSAPASGIPGPGAPGVAPASSVPMSGNPVGVPVSAVPGAGAGMATPGWDRAGLPFRPEEDPRGPLQDPKAPLPVRTPMANTPPVPEHVSPYDPAEARVDQNWSVNRGEAPAAAPVSAAPKSPFVPPAAPVSSRPAGPPSGAPGAPGSAAGGPPAAAPPAAPTLGGALPRRQPGQSTGGGSMSSMAGFVPSSANAANVGGGGLMSSMPGFVPSSTNAANAASAGGGTAATPTIRPASPAAAPSSGLGAPGGFAGSPTGSTPASGFGPPGYAPNANTGTGQGAGTPVSGYGAPGTGPAPAFGQPGPGQSGLGQPGLGQPGPGQSGPGQPGTGGAPGNSATPVNSATLGFGPAGNGTPPGNSGYGAAPGFGPGGNGAGSAPGFGPSGNGSVAGPGFGQPGNGAPAAPGGNGQQPVSPAGSGGPAGPGGLPRRQVTPPSERPTSMAAAAQALGAARTPTGETAPPTWTRQDSADRFGPSGPAPSIAPRPEPVVNPAATTMTNLLPPVIPGAPGVDRSAPYPASGYGAVVPGGSGPAAPQAYTAPPPSAPASPYGLLPQGSPASAYATQSQSAFATQVLPVATGGYHPSGASNMGVSGSATGSRGPAAEEFVPANEVERELQDAADTANTDVFLSTLLLAKVLVPVANNSRPGSAPGESGFAFLPEDVDGERFLIVFTSKDRLFEHFGEPTRTVEARFYELIRNWPDPSWSFAVNPGTPVGAKYPGAQIIALANWATEAGLGADPMDNPATEILVAPVPAPEPASDEAQQATVMQKTISAELVDYYLERGYDRVAGFVHRASEVEHLRTPGELFGALGLFYETSPFPPDAKEAFVLRWPAYRPSLYRIPYGGQNEQALRAMDGWVIERPPFRGNGFAPGEGRDVIAEFKVDSVRLPHGAQLWNIDGEGNERMIAIFDADGPLWRRVGDQ